MRLNARAGIQAATFDGPGGDGLSVFLTQNTLDPTRWRFEVYAHFDGGAKLSVGKFYSSPPAATVPNGQLTRMIAAVVCPGAVSWTV